MSGNIIQLNEEAVKGEIKDLLRKSVEETLNDMLNAEAEELIGASRYERSEEREGYRSGHYTRSLTTTSGEVQLKVPKLKGVRFDTAIIERYKRRECSVEETLIEMYLAGVYPGLSVQGDLWFDGFVTNCKTIKIASITPVLVIHNVFVFFITIFPSLILYLVFYTHFKKLQV